MALSAYESVSTLLSLASVAMFLLVARTVWVRPVSHESQRARNAFVVWWAVLGFVTLVGLVLQLPGATSSVAAYVALTIVLLGLLCVGLWGLLFYLVYLFTSRRGIAVPLGLGYALVFVFFVAFILAGDPVGFETGPNGRELEYNHPIESGPLYWTAIALLIVPPLAGAAGYLSLYWKVDQPVQKRRILLVSMSILVWFGSSLIGIGLGASESQVWSLVSRAISLAAAVTIYYAYSGLKPGEPQSSTMTPKGDGSTTFYQGPPRKGVSRVLPLSV